MEQPKVTNTVNDTTVLFVDDEERVLKSMRAMFRREYNVLLANSGREALERPLDEQRHARAADRRKENPDLVGDAALGEELPDVAPALDLPGGEIAQADYTGPLALAPKAVEGIEPVVVLEIAAGHFRGVILGMDHVVRLREARIAGHGGEVVDHQGTGKAEQQLGEVGPADRLRQLTQRGSKGGFDPGHRAVESLVSGAPG